MAKHKENTAVESTETVATDAAAPAPARGKKVMITPLAGGEPIARADWIKARFAELGPTSRSQIKKELKDLFGHEVPYQIVFAATKTPKAAAPVEAVAAVAAVEGETAAA